MVQTEEERKKKKREYSKKYYAKSEVKARTKKYVQKPEVREKARQYNARPEVKARRRKYTQSPEVKARINEYNARPEVKAHRKKYNLRPEVKAKKKENEARPEVKAKRKAYRTSPQGIAKRKENYARPEVKARILERSRRPEVKARRNEFEARPEIKARRSVYHKINTNTNRFKVLQHYSKTLSNSDIPCCRCCGLDEHMDFLAIDHIAGKKQMDSEHELIKLGYSSKLEGNPLLRWVIKNNFPDGFQVLCHTCNHAKGMKKNKNKCPHETMEWNGQFDSTTAKRV